ncbi:uncharacterized protein [Montipora capricornis]|uniref:uncharacterized protein isoform X1 n=1 Tax=Montipora capricornis TaxID=246305 RepID=UPI0035F17C73
MKGVFRSRPPVPRYEATWDVQVVLSHLASFAPVNQLDLKSLTHKLVMLVALVSAQRMQSIHLLDLQLMKTGTDMVEFAFPTHIRQSRPGYKTPSLQLKAYPADPGLCVVTHLREYLVRTQELRGSESKLLISYVRRHHAVSKDTIARWTALLRRHRVNAAFFHLPTAERFTRVALLKTMTSLGVQQRPIMIRMVNGETAYQTALLRRHRVNAAFFHLPTAERFTRVALLKTMTSLGVQQRPIMIRMVNGEIAYQHYELSCKQDVLDRKRVLVIEQCTNSNNEPTNFGEVAAQT